MQTEKTVFALATPIGGAIAIIRISGRETLKILREIFTGTVKPNYLSYGKIVDGNDTLDEVMAVYFMAPKSYTGEDMAEIHIHASTAVAENIFELLMKKGAVPAQAGEFSRRAFLNGKMKLTQAEAIMDLISSSAKRSASSAMLQLSGKLSEQIEKTEKMLVDILSQINATIDYPDEMEEEELFIFSDIKAVLSETEDLLERGRRAHYIRDGFTISIVGCPNAGKSSLLNALTMQEKAIVTHVAGTTRDVIEASTSFCGLPVRLFDTAGLHETEDEVEKIGIERTRRTMESTDLVYVAIDGSKSLSKEDMTVLNDTADKKRVIVLCKSDMPHIQDASCFPESERVCLVSSKTGEGLQELKRITSELICPDDETGIITNMRHIKALEDTVSALSDAANAQEIDCVATDIQRALHSISEITGNSVDEDVITRIFERFCVGK